MTQSAAADFGTLLRKFRNGAGFSQEELAERAAISAKAVSALERGFRKSPYRETVRLLAAALELDGPQRAQLEEAARRPARATAVPGAPDHAPPFPSALTSLVGRDDGVREIEAIAAQARLVTVLGPGGVGKTRIALAIGERARAETGRGVAFVDLSPLTSPEYVVSRAAATLGVHEGRGELLTSVASALGGSHTLLILDNCEHVVFEAARVSAHLLAACPNLTILATSREALNVPGERLYRLPPLALAPAAQLFVERATSVDAAFRLSERDAPFVDEICRRLDGLPLAIELAAMRTSVLGVERLAAKLDDRLRLLAGGSRIATPRQQTMRALIDWSYDLLDERERCAFRALSIFAGGWTLDAAASVCFDGVANELDALEALVSLADKSLLVVEPGDGDKRYRMLETIRAYGLERLESEGEREALARRHAEYFTEFATDASERWSSAPESASLASVEPELDNFRAAFAWSAQTERDRLVGARLAAALWRFWQFQVEPSEGLSWIERGLAVPEAQGDPALVASLLLGKAFLVPRREQLAAVEPAVAAYRALGDERRLATALMRQGDALWAAGELPRAQAALEEALEIDRRVGTARAIATVLTQLATVRCLRGQIAEAREAFGEVLALFERTGPSAGLAGPQAIALTNFAELEFNDGNPERALELAARALDVSRRVNDHDNVALLLCNLAGYSVGAGRIDDARRHAREALELLASDKESFLVAAALESLAHVALAAGKPEEAARLAGFADARRSAMSAAREPGERANYDRLMAGLCERLDDAVPKPPYAEGARLTAQEALTLGLAQ
jgi:predicted ATPase/DNA-binding XRE family transcriptional regulator